MGWFEEEFVDLKNKMKFSFRDLNFIEDTEKVKTPLVNIKETGREVIVKVKLPGVTRKDVSIKITADNLEVRAERVKHIEIKKEGHYNSERSQLKYYRLLKFPTKVNHKKGKVEFKEGILKVVIPKE